MYVSGMVRSSITATSFYYYVSGEKLKTDTTQLFQRPLGGTTYGKICELQIVLN